jgi:hypothetical protein
MLSAACTISAVKVAEGMLRENIRMHETLHSHEPYTVLAAVLCWPKLQLLTTLAGKQPYHLQGLRWATGPRNLCPGWLILQMHLPTYKMDVTRRLHA